MMQLGMSKSQFEERYTMQHGVPNEGGYYRQAEIKCLPVPHTHMPFLSAPL